MSSLAVALVVVAGLLHASWNFVAKKVGGDLRFAALSSLFMVAIWAPFVLPTSRTCTPSHAGAGHS